LLNCGPHCLISRIRKSIEDYFKPIVVTAKVAVVTACLSKLIRKVQYFTFATQMLGDHYSKSVLSHCLPPQIQARHMR
jgi:hypothetical protein